MTMSKTIKLILFACCAIGIMTNISMRNFPALAWSISCSIWIYAYVRDCKEV